MGQQCLFPYQSFPSQVTGGRLFLSVKVGMLNLSFRDIILEDIMTKTIPKKKKCKKAKWLYEETLQIAERSERQRRKGKIYPTERRVPRKSKEREESLK